MLVALTGSGTHSGPLEGQVSMLWIFSAFHAPPFGHLWPLNCEGPALGRVRKGESWAQPLDPGVPGRSGLEAGSLVY